MLAVCSLCHWAVATHLSEDNLKLICLPAALLPPLPRLTSYQSDVVTLQE